MTEKGSERVGRRKAGVATGWVHGGASIISNYDTAERYELASIAFERPPPRKGMNEPLA
jgi:hypothetical protein